MGEKNNKIYEFGEFYLDAGEQIFRRNGESLTLTPKVFDLLVVLVENHGHLLTKDELVKKLWAESFVEEANLNVTISALRKVLGEKPNEARFIETVPRRGYRFVAQVREISEVSRIGNEETLSEAQTVSIKPSFKHCPKCRKIYYDETLNFCLEDGEVLTIGELDFKPQTSENFSAKVTSGFRQRNLILYLLGGLAVILVGVLIWKFAFQSAKTEVSNIKTIAVLPFKPLSGSQSDGALEMGMADALITKLSGLQQITVRPTSSVSKFSEGNVDPIAAGKELQVETVLDGKIQRADNKIRVTVQLLRVSDGVTLWAGSFDDFFTNIFAVQDSISEKLTSTLALKLSRKEEQQITKRDTEDAEAYALFLQGRYFHEKLDKENSIKALEYYQKAIDKDPNYARAFAARSGAFGMLASLNINREENLQKAHETIMKALNLDPNLGEAYADLADWQVVDEWNFVEAEKNYRKAVELEPKESDIHIQYAATLSMLGRHDEAIKEAEKALQINPIAPYILSFHLQVLASAHRFEEARTQGKKYLELMPDDRQIIHSLMRVYVYASMFDEAEALLPKYLELNPNGDFVKAAVYLNTGKRAEGEKILRERLAKYKEGDGCYFYSSFAALLGDKEKTLGFLEKAANRHEQPVAFIAIAPEYDFLHNEPRFQALLKKIGLPQAN